jgi:threonine/homoserine efflux transporter RhtA
MSTEPAVGALVGFVFLQQVLGLRSIAAIALVCTAAVGASLFGRPDVPAREAGA